MSDGDGGDNNGDASDASDVPRAGRRLNLRYPGRCRSCTADLAAGSTGYYDASSKAVTCPQCAEAGTPRPEPAEVIGTAGASARREYDRRHQRREDRVRQAHPRLGGLLLALTDDPQTTRAWGVGAVGEERLAARLNTSAGEHLLLLHDRRIPGTGDWPLIGGDGTVRSVGVVSPRKLEKRLKASGPIPVDHMRAIHSVLVEALPSA